MGQELVIPNWAKAAKPAAVFSSLNPADDSLSDGIGQSYPVVGYKGKVWSLRYRGERKNFVLADNPQQTSNYIDVIILGQAKQKSKSYYKAYDAAAEGTRPICSSIDGVTPDPDVTQRQCETCILCPRNEWKTNPATGKKGRDCSDYKRLAVLILPTQTQPLFGSPVLEPAFLRVPAGSLNSLSIMGDSMNGQGFHYSTYITRISFDPNESHPKMIFTPEQGLTDAEGPVVMQMRSDLNVDRIINGGFVDNGGPRMVPAGSTPTGLTIDNVLANQPAQSPPPPPPPQQAPLLNLSALSAQPPQGTGLTMLTASPPTQPSQTPANGGDTGTPDASDDDLDASIAKMLSGVKK